MEDRYEEGGADDRPEDRKGVSADLNHEGLRQLQFVRDPRPEEGSDEAEGSRDDKPAAYAAPDGLPYGAADDGDDDEEDEPWQREGHGRVPFENFVGVFGPRQGNIDARKCQMPRDVLRYDRARGMMYFLRDMNLLS
jgi:hypothetical protein